MSTTNTFETGILKLIFQNLQLANVGDVNGLQPSANAGSFYMSLHTADPGEAGDQTTNETPYVGYTRIEIQRGASYWDVVDNEVSNANLIEFPVCTSGSSSTITHIGLGSANTGTGNLFLIGELVTPIVVNPGIAITFAPGQGAFLVD